MAKNPTVFSYIEFSRALGRSKALVTRMGLGSKVKGKVRFSVLCVKTALEKLSSSSSTLALLLFSKTSLKASFFSSYLSTLSELLLPSRRMPIVLGTFSSS